MSGPGSGVDSRMHQPYDDGYNLQRMTESIIRMEGRLDAVLQRLDRQEQHTQKCVDEMIANHKDQEMRLRTLEDWRNTMIGKFAVFGMAIAAGIAILSSWVTTFFTGGRP